MATAAPLVIIANPFKSNQAHTIQLHPLRLSSGHSLINQSNLHSCSPIRKDLKLQCFFSKFKKRPDYLTITKSEPKSGESQLQPRNQLHVIVNNLWESSLRSLRNSTVGALLLGLSVIMYNPKSNPALAAPVRRVGGSLCKTRIDSEYRPIGRVHGSFNWNYCNLNLGYFQNYTRITEIDDPYVGRAAAFYVFCFFVGVFFVVVNSEAGDDLVTKLKLIGLAFVLGILYSRRVQTNVVKLQVWFLLLLLGLQGINLEFLRMTLFALLRKLT